MLTRLWHHYDQTVWIRFLGQVITAVGNFMIGPFITLYLYEKLHIALMSTMLVAAISPAVGLLGGLIAGHLTDRLGRKSMMCISLFGQAAAMIGFGFASVLWQFVVITMAQGALNALFFPAASAQISDVVPEEQRSEVFSLLHMGLNIGAAVGPLVGATFYQSSPLILFLSAGISSALGGLLVLIYIPETKPAVMEQNDGPIGESLSGRKRRFSPVALWREYRLILWMTFLSLPIQLLYAQVRTNLPIHLSHHFTNYVHMYAIMQTFNGICVIALQMIVARVTRKQKPWVLIFFSFFAFSMVGYGYAWAPSLACCWRWSLSLP